MARLGRPSNQQLILILGILSAYGPLTIDLYMPALPTLAVTFDTQRVQQTMAAYFLGLSLGQLFMGPLSDRIGRRKPLLIGCVVYTLASLGCALSPTIDSLIAFRFVQALGGCVGMVLTTSVVRDMFPVKDAAKIFSYLTLVMGLAPILAPLIGGQILLYASWRVIFLVLAGFGLVCFFLVAWGLPESLVKENRNTRPMWNIVSDYLKLLRDPRFTRYALPNSLMGAGFFTYLAGAAIIFIDVYGVSAQNFGWIFALNALGLIASSQLNTVLLNHFQGHKILVTAMTTLTMFSLLLLGIAYSGLGGMVGLWLALFVCVGGMGLVRPNAVAATMAPFGSSAGSASSLMSALGSIAGAISGALLGFFQADTAVPMALIIAINYTLALVLFFGLKKTVQVSATD